MRVAINHQTIYRYRVPAKYSIQYLRLTPISGPTQRVLSWRLKGPGTLRPWTDSFGNAAHVLVVDAPHQEIRITAVGEVEIADGGKPLLADAEPQPPDVFLRSSRLTEADDTVRRFAGGFRPAFAGNPRKGLDSLVAGIRQTIAFEPKSDTARPTASARQALDRRSGACQDHAHLFVSCCRSLGVPARTVTGYLCTDAAEDGGMTSHAWAEAWLDGAGWLSFDVANRLSNAKAHVKLAVGMDYLDAAPVRGIRRGGGSDEQDIEITVTDARRLKERQQQQ
jgi:transglutaminase-like putative cysteine protease